VDRTAALGQARQAAAILHRGRGRHVDPSCRPTTSPAGLGDRRARRIRQRPRCTTFLILPCPPTNTELVRSGVHAALPDETTKTHPSTIVSSVRAAARAASTRPPVPVLTARSAPSAGEQHGSGLKSCPRRVVSDSENARREPGEKPPPRPGVPSLAVEMLDVFSVRFGPPESRSAADGDSHGPTSRGCRDTRRPPAHCPPSRRLQSTVALTVAPCRASTGHALWGLATATPGPHAGRFPPRRICENAAARLRTPDLSACRDGRPGAGRPPGWISSASRTRPALLCAHVCEEIRRFRKS